MKAHALCWQRHLHSKGKKTQGLNSIAWKYRKEILSKNTKKLRRLELGREKICLRKQQSHTEKNNNMKNLNITNIQLGMIYIYHIHRQRERIVYQTKLQLNCTLCKHHVTVAMITQMWGYQKMPLESPNAEITQPKFWLKGYKTRR